eukprot:CAMPEP_0183712152 /NCGR_PEP_ID=MMETSP0737-20130205/7373_1 /TAXON_ID=385413 /ORGANISM="Thalassiosira miniscula, Strain CCMP1093" /LENGTH=775 /DNA_ID=CAMNT_0025940731 /DNA_START=4 /DNA_END=2331 /DNA_ORIENTATION=-
MASNAPGDKYHHVDPTTDNGNDNMIDIRFSHVQLYVDKLCPVAEYKELESSLNEFHDGMYASSTTSEEEETTAAAVEEEEKEKQQENSLSSMENDIDKGRSIWKALLRSGAREEDGGDDDDDAATTAFVPHGRDVVKQLLAGFGFRITGCHPAPSDVAAATDISENDGGGIRGRAASSSSTNSVLVTSSDPNGIQMLVTSIANADSKVDLSGEHYYHFDAANIEKFYDAHSQRQGIAVLAFEVGPGHLAEIFHRYSHLHPALLPTEYQHGVKVYEHERTSVLEVFAYYDGEHHRSDGSAKADTGTRLRFVEPSSMEKCGGGGRGCNLPGIVPLSAEFRSCQPAYFDHWVSNVVSRTGFLETLEDVLSFTPKVDFNAGVVAAGEAQIESTVTGNQSSMMTTEKDAALKDQSQIYLPINNALTNVGHVHGFIEEIGQGVQHIASRVGNIIDFVQQANDRRRMLGEGFTFLNIPRSYYGVLTKDMLVKGCGYDKGQNLASKEKNNFLTPSCAEAIYDICASEGLLHDDCSLVLDTTEDSAVKVIGSKIPALHQDEYFLKKDEVIKTIFHSRYVNLYNLLRDHLSEESYVSIVRNKILVDVQGEDLLFQIFTSNILQRNSGEEAPFFEFIQRVCSECLGEDGCPKKLKPGCGGFGIRNFLTLFLSIEVTKAMLEASNAKDRGDDAGYNFAQRKVDLFTEQLNESNPLLTAISDAMTMEGIARDKIAASHEEEKKEDNEKWRLVMEKESLAKARANEKLMECNAKYQRLMKELRESQSQK